MTSVFVPGRVELMGNHTDYNQGYSLSMALPFGVTIQGSLRDDSKVHLRFNRTEEDSFSLEGFSKNPQTPWSDHIKGILLQLQQAQCPIRGFEAEITYTLPENCNVSMNPLIEVATLLLTQKLFDFELGDPNDSASLTAYAQMCQTAESDFANTACSILDTAIPLVAKKDHIVFFDCRTLTFELLPVPNTIHFVLCYPGTKTMLLSAKLAGKLNECLEAVKVLQINKIQVEALRDISSEDIRQNAGIFIPRVYQRALHITSENERVLASKNAILQGNFSEIGKLMFESHASSQEVFENSTPFLDQLVQISKTVPTCLGARLTGVGFGGCTLHLLDTENVESFIQTLTQNYKSKSGKDPITWIFQASPGASVTP